MRATKPPTAAIVTGAVILFFTGFAGIRVVLAAAAGGGGGERTVFKECFTQKIDKKATAEAATKLPEGWHLKGVGGDGQPYVLLCR